MPTEIHSDDGTQALTVTEAQFARIRRLLDLPERQFEALLSMAEHQAAFEDAPESTETRVAPVQGYDARGRLPLPIACRKRFVGGHLTGADVPVCSWARDGEGGFICLVKECARIVGNDNPHHAELERAMGATEAVHGVSPLTAVFARHTVSNPVGPNGCVTLHAVTDEDCQPD